MTGGRDRFAPRALEHLVQAIAAEALGVAPRDPAVRVSDAAGALAVTVRSPVAMPPLGDGGADADGQDLIQRLAAAAADTRARFAELTGLDVARVDMRATKAIITERRVR